MPRPTSAFSILRQVPLFARMTSAADLAQLERVAVVHTVAPKELIIADGQEVTAIYVIRSGGSDGMFRRRVRRVSPSWAGQSLRRDGVFSGDRRPRSRRRHPAH